MTLIHITAICPFFEIYEVVPEKKSEARLKKIVKMHEYASERNLPRLLNNSTSLTVKTGVHNPSFNF